MENALLIGLSRQMVLERQMDVVANNVANLANPNGSGGLLTLLNALGFNATVASKELGVSSAVKMCRSIMIKGLEAMTIECFTTTRA